MNAIEVFKQKNGDVTKAYYAALDAKGPAGQIATALFRAQKRSTAAKTYRGRRFRSEAYSVKEWSMSELCRLLALHGETFGIRWDWKEDKEVLFGERSSWVLYVDLPGPTFEIESRKSKEKMVFRSGEQVSFHCPQRLTGPDYPGEWDRQKESLSRILAFCDAIFFDQLTMKP
jgi:hypothetical protein